MWQFLESIENSGFSTFVRETPSVLAYPTVLALHTFGMAFLVGLSGVIAVRVLGVAPALPLPPLARFFPLIMAGFWVNAATGVILTALAAQSMLSNPDFYIKLGAIGAALVCLGQLRHHAFGKAGNGATGAVPSKGRVWAGAMLTFWGIAVLAGRLTAYESDVRRQAAVAVVIAVLVLLAVRMLALRVGGAFNNRATFSARTASGPGTPTANH